MAESAMYATPPSPDLSDEDMAMHMHPVVILNENASSSDVDQSNGHNSSHNANATSVAVVTTPTNHNGSASNNNNADAEPEPGRTHATDDSSAVAQQSSHYETADSSAAFPTTYQPHPHPSHALPQDEPNEQPNEPNGHPTRTPSPTNNRQDEQPDDAESLPTPLQMPPFALPFADFAAQLLKASANGAGISSPLHPSVDHLSKTKRRKQSAPNRLANEGGGGQQLAAAVDLSQFGGAGNAGDGQEEDHNSTEARARRQFLADFTQKLAAIVEQQEQDKRSNVGDDADSRDGDAASLENGELQSRKSTNAGGYFTVPCDHCPARFESELKLAMHVLQEHQTAPTAPPAAASDVEMPFQIRVKKELGYDNSDTADSDPAAMRSQLPSPHMHQQQHQLNDMHSQQQLNDNPWLPMPTASSGMHFPFTAEAAAMLSASGYLGQMPQLMAAGQMPNGSFGAGGSGGSDGSLVRPNMQPIRIFNPEAYCDLCNKEFCNKYFLKTHRANKHNIYDSTTSSSASGSSGSSNTATNTTAATSASASAGAEQMGLHHQHQQQQLNHMSQLFMQQQQQQHHQQQMQHMSQQQQMLDHHQALAQLAVPPPQHAPHPVVDTTVPCDVCHRRFSNAASMRRHRAKAHDTSATTANNATSNETNDTKPDSKFTLPDGFREDFTVEQEDTSFTPQIRKLSPASSQQARDSNFSNDKLRRLGVINPEAFCEICCKEYCNKYFLRTHKIKRHGIFMPMDAEQHQQQQQQQQPSTSNAAAAALLSGLMGKEDANKWLQFVQQQTTPLNLMMNAQHELNLGGKRSIDQMLAKQEQNNADQHPHAQQDAKRTKHTDSAPPTSSPVSTPMSNPNAESPHDAAANQQAAQDAISVDLQKLQSMIMQLNDLSAQRPSACSICGKEFDNQYALHAHVLAEHAPLGDNNNDRNGGGGVGALVIKSSPPGTPPMGATSGDHLVCKLCDKELKSDFHLRQHLLEAHGGGNQQQSHQQSTNSLSPSALALQHFAKKIADRTDTFVAPTSASGSGSSNSNANAASGAPIPAERRPYTITPTSSYCEICNKELCNKYFMKTHMQRMHGIEIENGAQIGGVICNICNKELCSKYFLRVHKHNTHGIIEEGAPLPVPRGSSSNSSNNNNGNGNSNNSNANGSNGQNTSSSNNHLHLATAAAAAASASDAANNGALGGASAEHTMHSMLMPDQRHSPNADLKPGEINDRYYAQYGEVCPLCSRRFRGAKWLRSHLMSDHGKAGVDKLRELEHTVSLMKQQQQHQLQQQANTAQLRIPGSSSGGEVGHPFDFALNLNLKQSSSSSSNKQPPSHKHDISSLFGGPMDDPMSGPPGAQNGSKANEYQCSFCPFTTPSYAFLFIHERSHSLLAAGMAAGQQQQIQQQQQHLAPCQDAEQTVAKPNARPQATVSPFQFPMLSPTAGSSPSATPAMQEANRTSPNHNQSLATSPLHTPPPPPSNAASADENAAASQAGSTATDLPVGTRAMLNDLANAAKLPAAYALPARGVGQTASDSCVDDDGSPLVMQSFLMEEEQQLESGDESVGVERSVERSRRRFVPSIVYLPVKQRFPGKLVVSFTLTPA